MNYQVIIQKLKDDNLILPSGKISPWISKKISSQLKDDIEEATKFLDTQLSLHIKVRAIQLGIVKLPVCDICGKPTRYHAAIKNFSKYCSTACASSSEEIKKKREITNLERFGSTTNLNIISKEQRVVNAKKAALESRKVIKEKYGVDNVMFVPEIKLKHQSSIDLVDQSFRTQKRQENFKKVMNVDHSSQKNIKNYEYYNDREFILENFVSDKKFQFQNFLDFFNISYTQGHIVKNKLSLDDIPNERNSKHKIQDEIVDFIHTIYSDSLLIDTRKIIYPLELDIVIPSKNLAIEFDGVKFHSYGKSEHSMFNNWQDEDKNKHLHKTQLCESQGIQLLHIFSNEWEEKQDIWKSVIKVKLGLADKIYARKCQIKEVNSKEAISFLNTTHLQGSINSSIRYGLYFNDDLVSIATFGKARYTKADWELLRFSSKLDTVVVGGFQKLINHFTKHHIGSLISYANRRWSNGNVYDKSGFELLNESAPNYFYIDDNGQLHSRIKFQKHKLNQTLGQTESEIMFNSGFRRIWDCGNFVYLYK